MNKTIQNILKYALFIGVAVGLGWYAFRGQDIDKIIDVMKNADYFWVGISVLIGFVAYISRGLRWLVLLEPHGHKPSALNSIYSVWISYFANFIAPRIGEVARCTAINRSDKVPFDVALGTVILERVIDMLLLLICMVIATAVSFDKFGQFFIGVITDKAGETDFTLIYLAIAVAVIGLIALIVLRKRLLQFALFRKIGTFVKGMLDGFASIWKMERKWLFLFHTAVIWGCYWGMTYVAFFAIPETTGLQPFDGVYVLVLGGLGMAAPAQGGIGSYHWIVSAGLTVYGIDETVGLGFATLLHGSQTVTVIIFGTISLVLLMLNARKNNANELSGDAAVEGADA